uniref:Uncharacterized protein n=1 Tax=Phlebotomus papatasi TaxID=29031 RepID=A0A1B0DGD4_PHLPP
MSQFRGLCHPRRPCKEPLRSSCFQKVPSKRVEDVVYSKDGGFLIQAVNISGTNHEKVMVKDLRAICKDSGLNATVFHPYFVFFDQFELVRPTSIQSMVIGAMIMMLISFIFIPNILCSLWVAFSIVSIELGVAGYMSLWDVNLDSISMINLIMCIGFSVDFTAHICYTYMSSKAKNPDDRVREALYSLGLPIVQGSFSTILGVVALLLADSYIFLVFFKMVFLVIFFGAMHGLFLLPVLLSLFGPGSCGGSKSTEKEMKLSAKRSWFYRTFITGGINREDPDNPVDNREHMLMAFFKTRVASLLNKGWMKALVILVFGGYLLGACFGLTNIKEGLERRKLSKADSYSVEFFDREDDYYREFPYRIQVIIAGDMNYSDPVVQNQIETLTQRLENTSYVTTSLYTESWIRSFLSYIERNGDYLNVTIDTEQSFIDNLKELWLFPGNPFSLDVKFNEDGTKILASQRKRK